jgi:hypothetical protein
VALPLCRGNKTTFAAWLGIFSCLPECHFGSSVRTCVSSDPLLVFKMSDVDDAAQDIDEESELMMESHVTWFCINCCPLAFECTTAAFKRAHCFGATPEEARARLSLHLQKSSLHKQIVDKDEADCHSAGVHIDEELWAADHGQESQKSAEQAAQKKRKTAHHATPWGGPKQPSMPPKDALRRLIVEAVQTEVARGSGAASSSGDFAGGGPGAALIRFTRPPTALVRAPAQMITVPKAALQSAADALNRGIAGTEHARKMMASGMVCFEQERDTLKASLEVLKEQLGGAIGS